jgi:hypothetical protein
MYCSTGIHAEMLFSMRNTSHMQEGCTSSKAYTAAPFPIVERLRRGFYQFNVNASEHYEHVLEVTAITLPIDTIRHCMCLRTALIALARSYFHHGCDRWYNI